MTEFFSNQEMRTVWDVTEMENALNAPGITEILDPKSFEFSGHVVDKYFPNNLIPIEFWTDYTISQKIDWFKALDLKNRYCENHEDFFPVETKLALKFSNCLLDCWTHSNNKKQDSIIFRGHLHLNENWMEKSKELFPTRDPSLSKAEAELFCFIKTFEMIPNQSNELLNDFFRLFLNNENWSYAGNYSVLPDIRLVN